RVRRIEPEVLLEADARDAADRRLPEGRRAGDRGANSRPGDGRSRGEPERRGARRAGRPGGAAALDLGRMGAESELETQSARVLRSTRAGVEMEGRSRAGQNHACSDNRGQTSTHSTNLREGTRANTRRGPAISIGEPTRIERCDRRPTRGGRIREDHR